MANGMTGGDAVTLEFIKANLEYLKVRFEEDFLCLFCHKRLIICQFRLLLNPSNSRFGPGLLRVLFSLFIVKRFKSAAHWLNLMLIGFLLSFALMSHSVVSCCCQLEALCRRPAVCRRCAHDHNQRQCVAIACELRLLCLFGIDRSLVTDFFLLFRNELVSVGDM